MKSIIFIRQILLLVPFIAGSIQAQTPFDAFVPEYQEIPMLEMQRVSYRLENNDPESIVRYLEIEKESGVIQFLDAANNVVSAVELLPDEKKFMTMDPMAEKYYSISPYAYCANNPVRFIDPDGREIAFSYEYEKDKDGNYVINENGGYNLTGVTMNVTGKVLNISKNGKIDVQAATNRIISQLEASFSGDVDGISFITNANLTVAGSMNEVAENDHLFVLADISSYNGQSPNGVANQLGGMVAFIDADYFSGPWDTSYGNLGPATASHEFGHLAGLEHSSKGLMKTAFRNSFFTFSTDISSDQLKAIHNNKANLNQGRNWESVPGIIPGTRRAGYIKKPNRGVIGSRYINY
ncbi:MAG: hypothetical protein LUG18_16200 [Candidatus Azobacteroides sp.]|nr:hypothetical protein [Candidatus Azobacteroides sp.]